MQNPTVESLRKAGYKVYVRHERRYMRLDTQIEKVIQKLPKELRKLSNMAEVHLPTGEMPSIMLSKGGTTHVEIICPDGQKFAASAQCSKKDCFNKKNGTRMALGRALKLEKLARAAQNPS